MIVVGGFTFDTPRALIENNMREIQKHMPKSFEQPVGSWAQGEMSTTGIMKFASDDAMNKYLEFYKYKMDPVPKPLFNRERLWMTMHKPAAERRDTRALNILTNIIKKQIKNPKDEENLLVCKLRGVIWWKSRPLFMLHYNNGTEKWYDENWGPEDGLPLSLQQARSELASEL